jgi:integrase
MEPCWFWKTVVSFMYFTGVRRRQLVMICWKDLNLETKTLFLSAQGEKTDIERTIPLVDTIVSDLRKYRKRVLNDFPHAYSREKQVFNITTYNQRYSGSLMNETQLSGFFKRLSKQLGFQVSPHRLRHTMATEIAKSGQIKPLQKILGHTTIGTTMNFYVHPDIEALRDAASVLCDTLTNICQRIIIKP